MRGIMLGPGQYNGSSVFVDACRGKFNVVRAPCWWKHKHSRMLTTSRPIGHHAAERGGRVCGRGEGVGARFIHSQPGTVMQRTCSRSVGACVGYNERGSCIIILSFRDKSVEYTCASVCAAATTGPSWVLSVERISWIWLLALWLKP